MRLAHPQAIDTKEMKDLLAVIRRQKHKSKRAHARTLVRNYNFECDWLI